ncbi:DNA polymerase III subunit gamma and tau [Frondihabitans sp. Leaf304]|uniref:DNA polymerase III subunit gamma and tau n=1 Tax=Frondihabitans sp. Leaf304 TaxID=1736329 RepID=UPI0006FD2811|nr:DNA polymerase III subunit gamma and tau [Frondihabitans sp. Leaf304]KQQ28136.1 DNA polymerase III subunit gamma/tau [Frondihabitans sp. Leaf304]
MVTALYRRYRPETFAELIGQTQVTDPLRTALRTNRVNHAYLFSGPRGCGKTTSARILARCLNCAEGPTDTPCGVCPSCVELARDGSGSLDVIEIDAASHGGVEDSRDLRDRAIFAPARDRYKIFILDEAHMVTNQGFNALLKIIEEPPEHVKFIFATTEPEKVIGTIRSRTHHYPFRLVPPAQMLDYIGSLSETEGVVAAPGVLPLVVRAGGGSVRDTLSLLDQLMAGSEAGSIEYERAVALLGYTHASLLDGVIDALGARDGAATFAAIDRVVQTGQDPRRFVEDLLERLRDLIVVGATNEGASAVLRGITADELDHLGRQAHSFGQAELSRSADVVNRALTDMTGATSPRLHLELMVARILVPESDESGRGALARVERLERRVGVSDSSAPAGSAGASVGGVPASAAPAASAPASRVASAAAGSASPGATASSSTPASAAPTSSTPTSSSPAAAADAWAQVAPAAAPVVSSASAAAAADVPAASAAAVPAAAAADSSPASASASASSPSSAAQPDPAEPSLPGSSHSAAWAQTPEVENAVEKPGAGVAGGTVSLQQLRDSWPEILEIVERDKLSAWMVVMTATVRDFTGDVLTLLFPSHNDVELFKRPVGAGEGVSEFLRRAIQQVLGIRVKYIARVEEAGGTSQSTTPAQPSAPAATPAPVESARASDSPASAPATAPSASAASASAPSASAQATAQSAPRAPAPAPSPSTSVSAPPSASAPTTGWDVAAIPQSAPPEPDEPIGDIPEPDLPETITEEPAGGVPPLGATPPIEGGASQSQPDAAGRQPDPSVSTPATAPRSAGRTIPQTSRYGEAVVREILGAQFIQEETIAPRVSPLSAPPNESN